MTTPKPLSVRAKIVLTVIVSVVALSITIYVSTTGLLLKSYLDIEREAMVEDLRRANDAISEFSNQQMIKLSDWAAWDEAYEYAKTRDEQWITDTMYATGLANLDINAMVWSDPNEQVFKLMTVDIEKREEVASSSVASYLVAHPELLHHPELSDSTKGVVLFPDGPAIMVSLPLRTSEGKGPSTGSLTFLRYLDAKKLAEFAEITHLNMKAFPYNGAYLPHDVLLAKAKLLSTGQVIEPITKDSIVGYSVLNGIDGNPALILRVETARPVYTQGLLTFYIFMGISALALILFGAAILWLLERLVIARFVRLTSDVDAINDDQDLSIRVRGGVMDEIGKLAEQINQMLGWLSASREETKNLLEEVKRGKDKAEDIVKIRTKELSEEKARLLASINSLAFGFVISGVDGTILLRNPSLTRILNLPEPPRRIVDIAKAFGSSFDLSTFCEESIARQVPGEKTDIPYGTRLLRVLCAPIFATEGVKEEQGTVIGYVLLIEDVTDAKMMQRSREEFFSIASHELRTPLTAIRGNTNLLLDTYKDRLPDKEMKAMLEDINASSARLISMVNEFLQISRLEQGKLEIKQQSFDLAKQIEEVVHSLSELAAEKGLTLSFTPVTLPMVFGDCDRTIQVLDNLIGNAIKFTEEGSVRIEATVEGKKVKVRVIDTGVGISPENQNRLFQKFQQAGEDMLARGASQSTGLGLYISKLIMNAMGGEVVLEESTLGKGSVFSFTLPIASQA